MEAEKIDIYPEYCLSFSPNWYAHQILSISKDGYVAYGSNDEVYVVSIREKKIVTSVTMRDAAVQSIKESAHKKITAVLITKDQLIMTNAFGYLAIFNKVQEQFEMVHLEKLETTKEIAYIRTFYIEEDNGLHFILGDVEQTAVVCTYRPGKLEKTIRVRKGKPTRNKYFYVYSYQSVQFVALVQEDSTIQLWDTNMKEQLFHLDLKKRVNTADMIMIDGMLLVALYSKSTGFVFGTLNLRNLFDDMISNKSKLEIFKEYKKTDIVIEDESSIPKDTKFIMQRVMWLDRHTLLLTGQLGEIYQISIPLVQDGQTITLKPFSLESLNDEPYELLEENPHYKAIYFIDRFENMVISIGVDRKVTFWDYNEDTILYSFSINCLGGKVDFIVESELEKQIAILVCRDNTIRIWDIAKKKNHFETLTLWKGLQNKVITHAAMHPTEEGLMAFATQENELTLYDLYTHSAIMTFEKQHLHVKFMKWVPMIYLLTIYNDAMRNSLSRKTPQETKDSQFECFFSKFNRNHKKAIPADSILLVVSESYGILLVDFAKEGIIRMDIGSTQVLSFDLIHRTVGPLKQTLMAHGNKTGEVVFNFCDSEFKQKDLRVKDAHTGSVSCIQFSKFIDGKLRAATGSYDRYINLYKITNFGTDKFDPNTDIKVYAKLKHKYRITQVCFSHHNIDQLLNVCDKHATVQIWDCSEEEKEDRRQYNIRGHRGFISTAAFALQAPNTVITGSDDQTVKVWNLIEIKNTKPPNKKKARVNKVEESGEEDEGSEEEIDNNHRDEDPDHDGEPPMRDRENSKRDVTNKGNTGRRGSERNEKIASTLGEIKEKAGGK